MSLWTLAWIAWIALFGIIEGAALINKRDGDTLSEHLWRWSALAEKGPRWRARRFALLAGLAWLVAHLLTGGAF